MIFFKYCSGVSLEGSNLFAGRFLGFEVTELLSLFALHAPGPLHHGHLCLDSLGLVWIQNEFTTHERCSYKNRKRMLMEVFFIKLRARLI